MITKRIIPCLDVRDGRVVKGTNFKGLRDVSSTKVRELVAEMITLMGSITSKEDLVRLRTLQRSFVLLVPKEIQKSLFLEYYYRKQ